MSSILKGIAIVTGSASGIGRAIAGRLARDGFDIGLFDLSSSETPLRNVSDEIVQTTGRRTAVVTGDVTREQDVVKLVETVTQELGSVDVVSVQSLFSGHLQYDVHTFRWLRMLEYVTLRLFRKVRDICAARLFKTRLRARASNGRTV